MCDGVPRRCRTAMSGQPIFSLVALLPSASRIPQDGSIRAIRVPFVESIAFGPAFMRTHIARLIAIILISPLAVAQTSDEWQSWPMGARFSITVAAYFPSLDTKVRVNASDGTTGTAIDFEQNLGMQDTETLPTVGFGWRFAKKHRLDLGYFSLKRSGSAVTTTQIRFGDTVFDIDLPVSSFFDVDATYILYSYSLLFDEKKELAVSAGLSVQDFKFGIQGNPGQGIIEGESGLTAPLPAIGISGGYMFTDRLFLRANLGVFSFDIALSDEIELRGEIVNAMLGLYHQTFENVRFGISYDYFKVNADFGNATGFNSIDYNYYGPALIVTANF